MKIKKIISVIVVLTMLFVPWEGLNVQGDYCIEVHGKDIYEVSENGTYQNGKDGIATAQKTKLVKQNNRLLAKRKTKYSSYQSVKEAAAVVRKAMVQHERKIVARVKSTADSPLEVFEALEDEVFKETKSGEEGDYLRWDIDREYPAYSYVPRRVKGKTYYYYEFNMEVWYFTTIEQKQQVDSKVKEIIAGFQFDENTTDYEKVVAIYDYVCENVKYAEDISKDIVYTSWSALFNGEAVCQGYAQLMYRMLKEVGISTRLIPGFGGGDILHGWNIVKLGDYYYNLDSTWDAENKNSGEKYSYFLKGDNFQKHERMEEYMTAKFYSKYPMAENSYGEGEQQASVISRQAKFSLIKPKLKKVSRKKISLNKVAEAYKYKVQYSTDKKFQNNTRIITTKKKKIKLKKLEKSKKYYVRFRAYQYIGRKKSVYEVVEKKYNQEK